MIDRVTCIIEKLLIGLLFGMFAMVTLLVVLRYLFSTTLIGGNEATVVAFIYTTALGAAVAISRDEHIAVTYFTDKLPPELKQGLARTRLVLLAILNALIGACAVIWIQRTGGFLMPTLGAPQIIAQISVPLGCGLSTLYCVARLLR